MFCRNCGTEMSDTAKFCSKCGTARSGKVDSSKEIVEDNQVKFQLKPKYNIPYKLITTIGGTLFYLLLISLIIVDLPTLWIVFPVTILVTMGIIVVYIVGKIVLEKMQYDHLEYNFYATKVEYKDGFLNKEEKELKYKYIREIVMNQNVLERLFNIGTIRIFTNASSGMYRGNNQHNNMKNKNGLYIHCVNHVQEQYKTIKQIIDEGTPEE